MFTLMLPPLLAVSLVAVNLGGLIFGHLAGPALDWILTAVAAAFSAWAAKALTTLLKKWHIDLTDAQQQQLRAQVQAVIRAVEEDARRGVISDASDDKLNIAVQRVIELPAAAALDRADAAKMIHEELPVVRRQVLTGGDAASALAFSVPTGTVTGPVPSTPATFGQRPLK